jgi:hypothetical protein
VRSTTRLAVAFGLLFEARPSLPNDLPEPAGFVPANADFIAYVDVATLFSSPSLRGLEAFVARQISADEIESFRELTGMDPWRDFHAMCFFSQQASEEENSKELWGVAISGAFDVERVLESMRERMRLELREYRESEMYVLSEGMARDANVVGQPLAIAFPDGSTALFGSVESVERMLDTALGFAPSSSESRLRSRLEDISTAEAFWAVGVGEATLGKAAVIPPLRSYAVTLRAGTDVRVRAWAEAASAEDANELADAVRGAMALVALAQGPASGAPALESVEIERVDDTLEVSFDVDGRTLRKWLFERKSKESRESGPVRE